MSSDARIEPTGITWKIVSRFCKELSELSLSTISRKSVDERTTDYERGKIAAYEEILSLANEPEDAKSNDTGPLYN